MLTSRRGPGQFASSVAPIFRVFRGLLLEFPVAAKSSCVAATPAAVALRVSVTVTVLAPILEPISVRPPPSEVATVPSAARAEYQRRRDHFFVELQRLAKVDRKL